MRIETLHNDRIKLIHGDCLDVMRYIKPNSIDMVFADLPYGITQCKWDTAIPLDILWQLLKGISKQTTQFLFTASQPFTTIMVQSNLQEFKYEWIWQKNAGSNFGATRFQPMKEHESVLVFYDRFGTYNPIMQKRAEAGLQAIKRPIRAHTITSGIYGLPNNTIAILRDVLRVPSSVQLFKRQRGLHPTQKPLELLKYLIKTYTNENDVVLDPVFGSGTTVEACIKLNRKCIAIEKDDQYFEIGLARAKRAINELGVT